MVFWDRLYRYPNEEAAEIALRTTLEWLEAHALRFLDAEEARDCEAHLSFCDACRARQSEIADLLELTGGNAFKVRAYRQAAQVVDVLPGPLQDVLAGGHLEELPGIGSGIGGKIAEMLQTGSCHEHDRLAALVPPGVLDMLRVEGVGPKTASAAWKASAAVRPMSSSTESAYIFPVKPHRSHPAPWHSRQGHRVWGIPRSSFR